MVHPAGEGECTCELSSAHSSTAGASARCSVLLRVPDRALWQGEGAHAHELVERTGLLRNASFACEQLQRSRGQDVVVDQLSVVTRATRKDGEELSSTVVAPTRLLKEIDGVGRLRCRERGHVSKRELAQQDELVGQHAAVVIRSGLASFGCGQCRLCFDEEACVRPVQVEKPIVPGARGSRARTKHKLRGVESRRLRLRSLPCSTSAPRGHQRGGLEGVVSRHLARKALGERVAAPKEKCVLSCDVAGSSVGK